MIDWVSNRYQDQRSPRAESHEDLLSRGFASPTPIQSYGWPLALSGRDCVAIAKTGSGKTLAFLLPVLLGIRGLLPDKRRCVERGSGPLALVLAPTRELALQIHGEAERCASTAGCRALCCHGGAEWTVQAAALEEGCELLVATPGRLCFLVGRGLRDGDAASIATAIAECGHHRRLAGAVSAFQAFVRGGGVATRRVFSALLNSHVLSGDVLGALHVLEESLDSDTADFLLL